MTAGLIYNPNRAFAWVQPGGFGQLYKDLPPETTVGATSGGGFSSESDFTGRGVYVGSRRTGNKDRVTGDLSTRRDAAQFLIDLALSVNPCYFNMIVLMGCSPTDITNFVSGRLFLDSGVASFTASDNIVQQMEVNDPKVLDTIGLDAAIELPIKKLAHQRVGAGASADPWNDVIPVSALNCAGYCGSDNDGNREFIAVGSPTAPSLVPKILYTADMFTTNIVHTLVGVTDGDAVSVALHLSNVFVAVTGTSGGVYRVSLQTVKTSGGTLACQLVSGISAGTAVNRVFSVGGVLVAVGDTGKIWVSIDHGFTFKLLTTGSTANLHSVGGSDENLIWVGGASGALFRIKNAPNGALVETITSGLSDDILSIDVPFGRINEVYFGTAAGEIWQSFNATDPTPTFTEYHFDLDGTGTIPAIKFGDARGAGMFFIQTNGSSKSRVFRDLSSGNGNAYAIAIDTFAAPANAQLNALAVTSLNNAAVVGEVVSASAYIGYISG